MSIAIYDNFDNSLGEFPNYDTYDAGQRTQLARQKHVDIRSFSSLSPTAASSVLDPTGKTLSGFSNTAVTSLEAGAVTYPSEGWTLGTVAPQSDRNNFDGISLTCAIGETDTQSIMTAFPVNLTSFGGTDYISLALPAFPQADLDLVNSYLDISPDAFNTTCSLKFSQATLVADLNGVDYEARFPFSLISGIDLSKINAVRLRIEATTACTFRCLAIRAIASTWEFAPTDQNTLYQRLGPTVPPTGSLTQEFTFPEAANPVTPANWPILLRSDGQSGPTMVDVDLGVTIHVGSNQGLNTLSFYLRELPMIWRTMKDLNGMTMQQIADLQRMPDWTAGTLDNFAEAQSIIVTLEWGRTNQIILTDTITTKSYSYALPALTSGQDYYLQINLEDESLRVRLYPTSYWGVVNWAGQVFDTTAVIDGNFNRRRKGRIGWYAYLQDGDSYVRQLRPRRIVYGEYRSNPMPSITPVVGAQIFASTTPPNELYQGYANKTAIVSPNATKSQSGQCLQIVCDGSAILEGMQTTPMMLENLFDTTITFRALSQQARQLVVALRGDTRLFALYQSAFTPNIWTDIEIPLNALGRTAIPGVYTLFLLQNEAVANTFYIDQLSISTPTVCWEGRVPAGDPWPMNNPEWIKFGTRINSPYDGAYLGKGNSLQVRGQAITQDGYIDQVKIVPKYATLGNFVWLDQEPNYRAQPVAHATATTSGLTVSCDASQSILPLGTCQFCWRFGDGMFAYGQTVSHTYALPGTYTITLTAIDALNQQQSTTISVTVT